jgi:nitroimidazol reductase NimA-like FMN-containing flavoprotein (pyridoxamine 5'-phosphate oxidase superfamily)
MRLIDNRTGIEVLDRAECLQRLEADVVGRLALVVAGSPAIFPVNYAMDGEAVVIRTAPGTKLDAAPRAPACFEIDSFDRTSRTGWSVVVNGRLEEVTSFDTNVLLRIRALPVDPWAKGDKDHWMRLVPHLITGRRVG